MNINKYKFKKFSILGDSLSTLAGYNPPGYEVFYTWEVMRLTDTIRLCKE